MGQNGNMKFAGYALNPEKREKEVKEDWGPKKERPDSKSRTAYHRDRDRIIWSTAFRRMQNKTQVFAHDDSDHLRRRLTHSIEVAGIACSIARRLKLNEVATDAIALGHDIGHAPFGHAGENALNDILKKYDLPKKFEPPIPINGFDHCAHAIEVLSRIETLNGTNPGLGLTFDIRDGILKHIYHTERTAKELKERPFSALSEIVKCEKYKLYGCNYGSLEAQCVWFADKLTYLFDDLEDAIRANIFNFDIIKQRKILKSLGDTLKPLISKTPNVDVENRIRIAMEPLDCYIIRTVRASGLDRVLGNKFQNHYKPEGMKKLYVKSDEIQENHPGDGIRQFLFWRNKAMTVMINDCVEASQLRITKAGIGSVKDVLNREERLIDVSDDLKNAWRDSDESFYEKAMYKTLFEHRMVLKHAYNAEQKIRKLFKIYRQENGYKLIPEDYKKITEKNYDFCKFKVTYKDRKGEVKEEDAIKIITITNYIAGMSDAYVNQILKEYIIS
ncbi:MAG: dNTP triphosphohydrolase [Planctomycetes bacterium]|nr:dNTP triphosphohydrolase [Planctomycetota bacterium]